MGHGNASGDGARAVRATPEELGQRQMPTAIALVILYPMACSSEASSGVVRGSLSRAQLEASSGVKGSLSRARRQQRAWREVRGRTEASPMPRGSVPKIVLEIDVTNPRIPVWRSVPTSISRPASTMRSTSPTCQGRAGADARFGRQTNGNRQEHWHIWHRGGKRARRACPTSMRASGTGAKFAICAAVKAERRRRGGKGQPRRHEARSFATTSECGQMMHARLWAEQRTGDELAHLRGKGLKPDDKPA